MNNFLLVIAKNTKPLLPFSPNLSIYLSGMQLAVHILLSGLDYDEPLRDIRGGGGGFTGVSGGLVFRYLYCSQLVDCYNNTSLVNYNVPIRKLLF